MSFLSIFTAAKTIGTGAISTVSQYWFIIKWAALLAAIVGYGIYCVHFGYKISENEHAAATAAVLIDREKLQKQVIDDENKHSLEVSKINADRKKESTALKQKLANAIANAEKVNPEQKTICKATKEEVDALNENIRAANAALGDEK